jgi:hypothetical protein
VLVPLSEHHAPGAPAAPHAADEGTRGDAKIAAARAVPAPGSTN